MPIENFVNCWNPEMGISSQAPRGEGSETTKYKYRFQLLAQDD